MYIYKDPQWNLLFSFLSSLFSKSYIVHKNHQVKNSSTFKKSTLNSDNEVYSLSHYWSNHTLWGIVRTASLNEAGNWSEKLQYM